MSSSDTGTAIMRHNAFAEPAEEKNGVMLVSADRPFAHDEAAYDTQYVLDANDVLVGRRLTDLLQEQGITEGAKILEIGCGTGLLSLGLAACNFYSDLVVTDGSMRFLDIARKKMLAVPTSSNVCFALLTDADIDKVADQYFDVIVMRSVLHHIDDFNHFASLILNKVKPAGVLAMYEPRAELFLWMATVAALFPSLAQASGITLTPSDKGHLDNFVATMQYYLRRDIDKSDGEDKYAFWITDLLDIASTGKARTVFRSETNPSDLTSLFVDYLKYCMGFPPDLIQKLNLGLVDFRETISTTLKGCNIPDLAGWFLMVK